MVAANNELMQALPATDSPYCEDGQLAIDADYEFNLNYAHTSQNLLSRWGILFGFAVVFMGLTYVSQRRKDEI